METGVFKSSREVTGNKKAVISHAAITERAGAGAGAWGGASSVFGSYVVKQAISFKKMKAWDRILHTMLGMKQKNWLNTKPIHNIYSVDVGQSYRIGRCGWVDRGIKEARTWKKIAINFQRNQPQERFRFEIKSSKDQQLFFLL